LCWLDRPQTELAAKDEYGFLVPYFPPDFYCDDLWVGLEVLEQEGGYGDEGGQERERGSPDDELLLVGGQAEGRVAAGAGAGKAGQVGGGRGGRLSTE
jgi:hypothetical protein